MDASGAEDATDFRPFFDMVIGILFVLLILVAAQIYFQQAEDQTADRDATRREAALRRAEIASFLDALAGRLRAGGLTPAVDAERGAVVLPLGQVLFVGANGLPVVQDAAADRLGAAVAELTGCVTVPRAAEPACTAFQRLGLDSLAVTMNVGALPPRVALPRDRFADLGGALLSAKLMGGAPALVAASNASGERVVGFGIAPGGAVRDAAPDTLVDGDLVLDFSFDLHGSS